MNSMENRPTLWGRDNKLLWSSMNSTEVLKTLQHLIAVKIEFHQEKIVQISNEEDVEMHEIKIMQLQNASQNISEAFQLIFDNTNESVFSSSDTDVDFSLIDGVFNPGNARELLLNFINHKISYHQLKDFSSKEKYGTDDFNSKQRIETLQHARESINQLIEKASTSGKNIAIASAINVSIQ